MSGCGSLEVRVTDLWPACHEFKPVPLKTHHVGKRCMLNLLGAQTSSRWCSVEVSRSGASSDVVLVTRPWFKITRSVSKIPLVAEQCAATLQLNKTTPKLN
ncbi:uncharacterized protein TNCV_450311 [Trichonephila clavipes]|nr:uncharacterized protein TNCV_450311 [Trichonephila clavipes]